MLTLLKTWLTNNASNTTFSIRKLCDLEKSCCPNVQTKFFDFDKIKEWYQREAEVRSYKSVDALYIHEDSSTLYFVEMKGWKKFLERSEKVCDKKIRETTQDYQLDCKFKDSLSILESLIHWNKFKPQPNGEHLKQLNKSAKQFILVTDLDSPALATDPLQEIVATIVILGQTSSKINLKNAMDTYTDEALNKLKATDYGYTNLQPPKRLNCSQVDQFFNNLNSK